MILPPPFEDTIADSGTVRWAQAGSNRCPTGLDEEPQGDESNDNVPQGDIGGDFIDAFQRRNLDLWVAGQRISSLVIHVSYASCSLIVNGVLVDLGPRPYLEPSPDSLMSLYGHVPYVVDLLEDDLPITTAVAAWRNARNALMEEADRAFEAAGLDSALAVYRASDLVENVQTSGASGLRVFYRGMGWLTLPRLPQPPPPPSQQIDCSRIARKLINRIRDNAATFTCQPAFFLTGNGDSFFCAGEATDQVLAQVMHILRGGAIETLPSGPFLKGSDFVREIYTVTQEQE